jgi:hypothetical protein
MLRLYEFIPSLHLFRHAFKFSHRGLAQLFLNLWQGSLYFVSRINVTAFLKFAFCSLLWVRAGCLCPHLIPAIQWLLHCCMRGKPWISRVHNRVVSEEWLTSSFLIPAQTRPWVQEWMWAVTAASLIHIRVEDRPALWEGPHLLDSKTASLILACKDFSFQSKVLFFIKHTFHQMENSVLLS